MSTLQKSSLKTRVAKSLVVEDLSGLSVEQKLKKIVIESLSEESFEKSEKVVLVPSENVEGMWCTPGPARIYLSALKRPKSWRIYLDFCNYENLVEKDDKMTEVGAVFEMSCDYEYIAVKRYFTPKGDRRSD